MISSPPAAEQVRLQVELLRKKLLDLTTRNRMLSYRPSKRIGITIVGEDSTCVYDILVSQGKKMSFQGKPDPAKTTLPQGELPSGDDPVAMQQFREMAEDELNAYLTNPVMPVDQLDTKLNVDDYESVLQAKLRTIEREARVANEELGINTLFLTLGTLEWRETDERSYHAPLLFVPVALKKLANGSMRVSHDGSDIGFNLPLQAKLQEFNLKLPQYDDEQPVASYFSSVESTIRSKAGWIVHRDAICLGFFNYEKYAMYVDLGGEYWPEDRKPWMNEDVAALLSTGYSSPDSPITDLSHLDGVRPPQSCHEVYDADSSQTLAMIRAAEGLSIVVEGPPGTGKSQTITNIIAEAVASGKTVLFVSAKRAALEVVKRRLEEAELGAMCLDMHDKLTNRREFYSEIKRTMSKAISVKTEEEKIARMVQLRDQLNAHSEAVNTLLLEFETTPFGAMCRLARLPQEDSEDRANRVDFAALRVFREVQIQHNLPLVKALQATLSDTGTPSEHPFWGCAINYLDPGLKLDLQEDIEKAIVAVNEAMSAVEHACTALQIPLAHSQADVGSVRAALRIALDSPPHQGVVVESTEWVSNSAAIDSAIEKLRSRADLKAKNEQWLVANAWTTDLGDVLQAYEDHSAKFFRFAIGGFRKAKTRFHTFVTASAPKDDSIRLQMLRDLAHVQMDEKAIAESHAMMSQLYGSQWQGNDSNPEVLKMLLGWVCELHHQVGKNEVPEGLLHLLSATQDYASFLPLVDKAEEAATTAIERYRTAANLLKFAAEHAESEPWTSLRDRLVCWLENLPRLPEMISYMNVRGQVSQAGLEAVARVADTWPLGNDRLLDLFLRSYYGGVVREAMQSRPNLRNFQRNAHEATISEFQSLDDFKLKYNRLLVRLAHQKRLPTFDNAIGNLQLLKIQCELQRAHKPIRWIMSRAGEAVQRIKPVFMMSPLSVAIHLPPDLAPFDLVIFDEASQIRPEDALCALARGKQCIVVGDTKQMPPTNFFDRMVDDGDDFEDEELIDSETRELGVEGSKLESVLALMSSKTAGQSRRPDLRWHYRSLHPALIQPSNDMFYNGRLIVFPSPTSQQLLGRLGVVFRHDPTSVYEGGSRKRINRQEAKAVAEAVLRHVQNSPKDSLMVAAMNKPQADLIDDEVQLLERMNPQAFQLFREQHPHEPLAVKNLENVQGDERDVIFMSVTYGRDASGVIRQHFGPLLRDGGERRLNVLITRARKRCEIFSNLSADDIRLDKPRPGVARLKEYLHFARTGQLDISVPTGEDAESPFEEEVAKALVDAGYSVHHQVGSQNFRIDLAVIDPTAEGRYLIGIECDGATYHSARSARDRDKLRQRILESRGWRLHRIWSHDWWMNREAEIQRLLQAIEAAKLNAEEENAPMDPTYEGPTLVVVDRMVKAKVRPYTTSADPGVIPPYQLGGYMRTLVESEGPIHVDLLRQRLREAAGFGRAGSSVRIMLDDVISKNSGDFKFLVDCYYAVDSQLFEARDWSTAPDKKTEFVPEAEIAVAIKTAVRNAFGVEELPAIQTAFRLMGFARVTEPAIRKGRVALEKLLAGGGIIVEKGLLYPGSK